ncbi:MAG TPA: MarR family transcriptional regulator [Longimicrobiales bacterium]|nr:MarR family transcriptional regulator [Longimicrobiales bacterium]
MHGSAADSLIQAKAFQRALLELLPLVEFRERELAAAYGISLTQCLALRLWAEERALSVNDLAARLYLDKSTASRVASGLETKGYLVRTRDRQDGRVVRLEPTPAGHRLRGRIEDDMALVHAELLSDFDPEVRSALTRMILRVVGSFSARVRASRGTCRVVG